jgi:hypothetical protein
VLPGYTTTPVKLVLESRGIKTNVAAPTPARATPSRQTFKNTCYHKVVTTSRRAVVSVGELPSKPLRLLSKFKERKKVG